MFLRKPPGLFIKAVLSIIRLKNIFIDRSSDIELGYQWDVIVVHRYNYLKKTLEKDK